MSIRKADIIPKNRSGRTGMKLKDRKEAVQQEETGSTGRKPDQQRGNQKEIISPISPARNRITGEETGSTERKTWDRDSPGRKPDQQGGSWRTGIHQITGEDNQVTGRKTWDRASPDQQGGNQKEIISPISTSSPGGNQVVIQIREKISITQLNHSPDWKFKQTRENQFTQEISLPRENPSNHQNPSRT